MNKAMDAIKTFPKFTILFVILMILEVLGLTVIPSYHIVSKPMILASLIGFYILEEKRQNHVFLTGLIFALLGDCFLLFGTDDMFAVGLTAFLIMQICYATTFNKHRRIPRNRDYIIPGILIIMGVSTLFYLWPDLGSMKYAVAVYTTAIIIMAIFAYLRHPKLRGYSAVFAGVILFIVSDALLAINKFGGEFAYAGIYVMITYMLAQYLIVTGVVLARLKMEVVKEKEVSRFARHRQKKK